MAAGRSAANTTRLPEDHGGHLAAKRTSSDSGGCAALVGIALLVLTFAWPLFVFHRHWTTYSLVNCSTYGSPELLNGCVFNSQTGGWTGTATASTSHSAI